MTRPNTSFHCLDEYESLRSTVQTQDLHDCIPNGHLIALRTKAEVLAGDESVDVYVCAVSLDKTSPVLSAISKIPGQSQYNLQHLRRVAKIEYLPDSLKFIQKTEGEEFSRTNNQREKVKGTAENTVYILLSPTALTTARDLGILLYPILNTTPKIHSVSVPLHPPSSYEQAANISKHHWPAVHNPNTSYGPSPSVVSQFKDRIQPSADFWIAKARQVGLAAQNAGFGTGVGVIVVSYSSHSRFDGDDDHATPLEVREKVVCAAGDASYLFGPPSVVQDTTFEDSATVQGRVHNPATHAILRATAMVARKRRSLLSNSSANSSSFNSPDGSNIFLDVPLTPLEVELSTAHPDSLQPHGYLCNELRFYVSHEPCVGCGMACVHSRVESVVFARTGDGGCGRNEMALGFSVEHEGERYGLHWREDLNWRFLAFEWVESP